MNQDPAYSMNVCHDILADIIGEALADINKTF
jgi:hypothetical protein